MALGDEMPLGNMVGSFHLGLSGRDGALLGPSPAEESTVAWPKGSPPE
jgi:hypothetical protein